MCALKTNAEIGGWSRHYQTALRKHIEQGPGASLQPAAKLGRQAVTLGMETLDVAKAHEEALMALASPSGSSRVRKRMIARARMFFDEAIVPIEKTHRPALNAAVRADQLNQTLHQRAKESADSNRRLKRTILQRRKVEEALKKSGKHHAKLMSDSHRLLEHLRRLTYRCMSAQEDGRKSVSHQLRNDVAQGLLGIHVRLLTANKAAKTSRKSLEKEIGSAQRLVRESRKKVARFAHECCIEDKA